MKGTRNKKLISSGNKKRILFLVNIVLMVALVTVATYAWFSKNSIDTVEVDQIAFEGSSDLEVSLTGAADDYGSSKRMSLSTSSLSKEVTGTGAGNPVNLKHAVTKDSTNSTVLTPDTDEFANWVAAEENKDYIKQTIYFRTKEEGISVYLGNGSYVKGADEIEGKSLVGDDVGHESSVKNAKNTAGESVKISKDCIVGATRVAFLKNTTTPNFVWIPRANIFYETTTSGNTIHGGTSYDLANLSTSYSSNPLCPNPKVHYFYIDSTPGNYQPTYNASAPYAVAGVSGLSSGSKQNLGKVLSLTNLVDGYYTGSVDIVIWVEGCDAEARRAFAGGEFGMFFQFLGFK